MDEKNRYPSLDAALRGVSFGNRLSVKRSIDRIITSRNGIVAHQY
jgi:hypothetical protein